MRENLEAIFRMNSTGQNVFRQRENLLAASWAGKGWGEGGKMTPAPHLLPFALDGEFIYMGRNWFWRGGIFVGLSTRVLLHA